MGLNNTLTVDAMAQSVKRYHSFGQVAGVQVEKKDSKFSGHA
jgi:hypothetical protein